MPVKRRLRSPIEGVTRFDPSSFGNVRCWFRADTSVYQDSGKVTKAVKNGDPIGYWTNQGPDQDLNQTVNASRPTLQLNAINGYPAINFISANGQFLISPGNIQTNYPSCIFVVGTLTLAQGDNLNKVIYCIGNPTAGNGSREVGIQNNTPPFVVLLKDQNDPYYSGAGLPSIQRTQPFLISVFQQTSDNTDNIYLNGCTKPAAVVTTPNTNNLTDKLRVGRDTAANTYFDGMVAELLVFDRPTNLTRTQFLQVNAYFLYKYGFYGKNPSIFPKLTSTA